VESHDTSSLPSSSDSSDESGGYPQLMWVLLPAALIQVDGRDKLPLFFFFFAAVHRDD